MARLPFKPSDEQRKMIEAYAAYGISQEEMCTLVGVSLKTLHKHFRQELDTGMTKANAKVAESLFRQAVGAPAQYDSEGKLLRAEQAPVVSAGIFWAKARMGWKETDVHEFQGRDGGPIEIEDARSKLADRLARLAAARAAPEGSCRPQPE
ncbi:MAG: hypothetical protein ACR65U_14480 [Methylocystis sp.]